MGRPRLHSISILGDEPGMVNEVEHGRATLLGRLLGQHQAGKRGFSGSKGMTIQRTM